MSSTYTSNLAIQLMANGDQSGTWGATTNNNLGYLEEGITGYQSVTFSSTTVTLVLSQGTDTSPSARSAFLNLTGAPGAASTLVVPNGMAKMYYIWNQTGQQVTVQAATPTANVVVIPSGSQTVVMCDNANNVYSALGAQVLANPTISGGTINNTVIGGTTPNAGTFTTLSASSTVSGTGFSTYLASPPAIGGTTPNTGVFTQVQVTGGTAASVVNGMYLSATNTLGWATNGTLRMTLNANGTWSIPAPAATAPAITANGAAATPSVALTFSATAGALDCSRSNVFTLTMTANVTTAYTLSNPSDAQTINWFITQDSTGTRTMTWPTSFKWAGGSAGVLSTAANAVDLLVITYRSSTGFWYASLAKAFA